VYRFLISSVSLIIVLLLVAKFPFEIINGCFSVFSMTVIKLLNLKCLHYVDGGLLRGFF